MLGIPLTIVALAVALTSMYLGLPIHAWLGLSGEATLSGPVGEVLVLEPKIKGYVLTKSAEAKVNGRLGGALPYRPALMTILAKPLYRGHVYGDMRYREGFTCWCHLIMCGSVLTRYGSGPVPMMGQ